MIFKVYYQEDKEQVPVRERTKAMYIEAESENEIYEKLFETPYLIEHIQPLNGVDLEFEKQSGNFKITEI
ncbi:DNA-dependent RNA polymerase subunit epsilon [Pallidibacillus pasinlerensis]|uniref:DNA-directed RNA polymerase subunit epsilon n=1 Tax=Pallidibacillus pasinlerensis TaxID=2703818 RepID=A0ABX0A0Z5_9BACI|nr:RNA polymerase epsilon subunit [Pallidibacillus pasinlerensis]NCU17089.1 DNA-dependent RNA polymerase auxiliary subunit epsilon family protein [Pallidibacillus pasinlerensis]